MPAAQTPSGDADQKKKAKVFFDRARTQAEVGNHEFAIDLYLQGLAFDPDEVEAHKAVREISLLRKAGGGKSMGWLDKKKLPKAEDDKQQMFNAEKLLAYDPANTEHMAAVARAANGAGFTATARWMEELLRRAVA